MLLREIIRQIRAKRSAKKQFDSFIKNKTNVALQDVVNNLPRPEKPTLRILCTSDAMRQQLNDLNVEDADYMVVNSFVADTSYVYLHPAYYVIADPYFYKVRPDHAQMIFSMTDWPMTLFIPWDSTSQCDMYKPTKNISIRFVNTNEYNGEKDERDYCYDHNLAMPPVFNVLHMAIYLGIYLGYKNIELYGVEHSWTKALYVGADNHVYMADTHFYDKAKKSDIVRRRMDGTYHKLHELLYEYSLVFKEYWELRELAERHNCKIINCTPNSYIDAFERNINK